ncbi:olfactory receptor 13G1-like [Hemicordylus capensis]|uniref:olfactory receptor 13G1-like n=1 Tax=Hemicordylus capensis TaxID=884348 RepID=UPI002303E70A|nr:olfactory receptor 13G1-like [Hemicordylus capensis]
METQNQSSIKDFILLGLSNSPGHQGIIFWGFTFIYSTALVANFLFILTISSCSKLHTPMYFLLINLSIANMFCISVTIPKMLQATLSPRKTISFSGCMAQVCLFLWALGTELLLLSFMAFDRYAAICHPLQYTIIMRREVCVGVVAAVWVTGMVNSAVHTGLVLQLSFCNSRVINHFFCNLPPLLALSCSDISLNEIMAYVSDAFISMGSCTLTLTSYVLILITISRIQSAEGKKKAFSTCSSHLLVVIFYFSTIIYTYIRPTSSSSLEEDKVLAILYTVVTPVLNPVIYSLRNQDVKEALKRLTGRFIPRASLVYG